MDLIRKFSAIKRGSCSYGSSNNRSTPPSLLPNGESAAQHARESHDVFSLNHHLCLLSSTACSVRHLALRADDDTPTLAGWGLQECSTHKQGHVGSTQCIHIITAFSIVLIGMTSRKRLSCQPSHKQMPNEKGDYV